MSEINLPFELRVTANKRSFVKSLKNSSWNYRLSILLLFFAVIINIMLILSIPVQVKNYEFYYLIKETIVGYDFYGCSLSDMPFPILEFGLTYTTNFHINYWLMIGLYSLIGSGVLLRSRSELRMLIRSYYLILSVVVLVGSVKIFIMIGCIRYYVLANILELSLFLTFFPIVFLIPMHYINLTNIYPSFQINQEILSKKKSLIRMSIMITYTIAVGVIYIGIQEIIA